MSELRNRLLKIEQERNERLLKDTEDARALESDPERYIAETQLIEEAVFSALSSSDQSESYTVTVQPGWNGGGPIQLAITTLIAAGYGVNVTTINPSGAEADAARYQAVTHIVVTLRP